MHRTVFTVAALVAACNASSADYGGAATKSPPNVPTASGPSVPPIVVVEGKASPADGRRAGRSNATLDRSLATPRETGSVGTDEAGSLVGGSDALPTDVTPSDRLERALDRLERDILGS